VSDNSRSIDCCEKGSIVTEGSEKGVEEEEEVRVGEDLLQKNETRRLNQIKLTKTQQMYVKNAHQSINQSHTHTHTHTQNHL